MLWKLFASKKPEKVPPFFVSEYLERLEKACIEMWEQQAPVDNSITLWWGLDGLRMEPDGSTRWISKRKRNYLIPAYSTGSLLCADGFLTLHNQNQMVIDKQLSYTCCQQNQMVIDKQMSYTCCQQMFEDIHRSLCNTGMTYNKERWR